MICGRTEKKLIAYLDGKLHGEERRQIEAHLATCGACRERADGFRELWDVLEELPPVVPSPGFDAHVRARVRQDANAASLWTWLMASPRTAFAAAALLIASIWLSSFQPTRLPVTHQTQAAVQNSEADFGMIKDLPVLEDYDVLTSFDALSDLPVEQQNAEPEPSHTM